MVLFELAPFPEILAETGGQPQDESEGGVQVSPVTRTPSTS